jgi:hypothetical protein
MADMSQTATLVIGYGEELKGRLGGTARPARIRSGRNSTI